MDRVLRNQRYVAGLCCLVYRCVREDCWIDRKRDCEESAMRVVERPRWRDRGMRLVVTDVLLLLLFRGPVAMFISAMCQMRRYRVSSMYLLDASPASRLDSVPTLDDVRLQTNGPRTAVQLEE
jgi:hypothetical protein